MLLNWKFTVNTTIIEADLNLNIKKYWVDAVIMHMHDLFAASYLSPPLCCQ